MPDSTCRWPECDTDPYSRGFCRKHYARAYRLGSFESPWLDRKLPKPSIQCRWPECESPSDSHGLCKRDYSRARRVDDLESPWLTWRPRIRLAGETCGWPECQRPAECKALCDRHYKRACAVQDFEAPWIGWAAYEAQVKAGRRTGSACIWPECTNLSRCRKFCAKHYERAKNLDDFGAPWLRWNLPRPCDWCGEEHRRRSQKRATATHQFEFRRQQSTAKFCTSECAQKSYVDNNPEATRKRIAEWARRNPDKRRMKDTEHDVRLWRGDICYLCGEKINFKLKHPNPKSPSLDHVIPLARGGGHTLANTAMTHLVCNVRKNAREVETLPAETLFAI